MKIIPITLACLCFVLKANAQGFLKAEYFFGSDPGVQNGTLFTVASSNDQTNFTFPVSTTGLSTGFHYLTMRVQHNDGTWSMFETRKFFILQTSLSDVQDIVAAEYYIDADPGAGNGAAINIGPGGAMVNFVVSVPTSLQQGPHHLVIRTMDASGKWGLLESRRFFVMPPAAPDLPIITAAEYFFDNDPGPGNGNPLHVPMPGDIVTFSGNMPTPCLSTGQHFVGLRVRDENDHWSLIGFDTIVVEAGLVASHVSPEGPITICANETVVLSTEEIPGIQYQWLLDGSNIPGADESSYIPVVSGYYSLKTICNGVFVTSNVVSVTILPLETFYADNDEDGYGDANVSIIHCIQPEGYVINAGDCDDDDAAIHEPVEYFVDSDEDGFGSTNTEFVCALTPPVGYSLNDLDCNDGNALIHPGAPEVCNMSDDDCDNLIDDADPDITGQSTWYADADGDGFGDETVTIVACFAPEGFVANPDDCDDTNAGINPGEFESCNSVDDDCDGFTDDEDNDVINPPYWYLDADGDGFGDPDNFDASCSPPPGYISDGTDCDDDDTLVHPGAEEICNGVDDDCDGFTDDDDEDSLIFWYLDSDHDGYGNPEAPTLALCPADGISSNNEDCNDSDPLINPEGIELCNGVDDDCNDLIDDVDPQTLFLSCPNDIIQSTDEGQCIAEIDYVVLLDANCGGWNLVQIEGLPSGGHFPVGTTQNLYIVTDAFGNTASCVFSVTITDNVPPIVTCPSNVFQLSDPGECGALITYDVSVFDNCDVELLQTAGLPSGSVFPIGTTVNEFIATDENGNTATASFFVAVSDEENPSLDCPETFVQNTDPGECGALITYSLTVDDNCPGVQIEQTSGLPSGVQYPVGTTTNSFLATDVHGNTSTCSFDVQILDNEIPTVDCPDDVTVPNDPGQCSAVITYTVPFDDNCPDVEIEQVFGLPSGAAFPVGFTFNSFIVTDGHGNTVACSFEVHVDDTELPVIDCPDDITANAGQSVIYTVSIDDNCTGETLQQTAGLPSGSVFPNGITTNSFTVSDASGNTATCSFTVTVLTAADYTVLLSSGNLSITDNPGNGEALTISQSGNNIRFNATGRTYSLNGSAATLMPVDIPLAGLNSITVNTAGGNDIVNVAAFTTQLPGLTINGGAGSDVVNMNGDIIFAGALDLDLLNDNATGTDRVTIASNANLNLIGSAHATIRVNSSVSLGSGASIETSSGNLIIEANWQSPASTGNFVGITMPLNSLIRSAVSGNVTVRGRGGNSSNGSQYGIWLQGGDIVGGTSGTLLVEGKGGMNKTFNEGVLISHAASTIASAGANVHIIGKGGTGTTNHRGVYMTAGVISAGGTGTVTIQGFAGSNGTGVLIDRALVRSDGGNISVTGTGGGSNNDNIGVHLKSTGGVLAAISPGGMGNVTVQGTGGASLSRNYGVLVDGANAKITSDGGNVVVNGTAGGSSTGASNIGVLILNAGEISTTAVGSLSVVGNGGNSSGNGNDGVQLSGQDSRIQSSGGNITVTGTGKGTGSGTACNGVNITARTFIHAAGIGNVLVQGNGKTLSGNQHYGVVVNGTNARITSASGNINIQGTAGGGTQSLGLFTASSGTVVSSSGNITLIANSMSLLGGIISTTNSKSTALRPLIDNTIIQLGITTNSPQGPLALSDAELDKISTGTLNIGNALSGRIEILTDITRSASTNMNLLCQSDILFNSGRINTANGTLLLDPGAGAAVKPIVGGNDVSASMLSVAGATELAFTSISQFHSLGVAGSVNLSGSNLQITGTVALTGGEAFTIVSNDGADAIIGVFSGLAEGSIIPNFLNSGLDAAISYIGGTGNDVVLTVNNPSLAFHPGEGSFARDASSETLSTDAFNEDSDEDKRGHAEPKVNCPRIAFPNPQHRGHLLQLSDGSIGEMNIVLSDLQGRVVVELKNYSNDWPMSSLIAGIYIYKLSFVNTENQLCTETGKLVIVE